MVESQAGGYVQPLRCLYSETYGGTPQITGCLSPYGTKVPFTLYSYENKVSVDSRQGWRLIWVGILLRLFVTRPNGCLTSLAKSETNLCGKGLSRRWPN